MRLQRNAVITDPDSGKRVVLRAGTEVEDRVLHLVDPRAFGLPKGTALGAAAQDEASAPEPHADPADTGEQQEQQPADQRSDEQRALDELVERVLEGTVAEVNAYLDEHPEHVDPVLAAEATGQARKGITEGPHAQGSSA